MPAPLGPSVDQQRPGMPGLRAIAVSQDIDAALRGWDYKSGVVQARLAKGADGRQGIQMRVDLRVLQMQTNARPARTPPRDHATSFDYLPPQPRGATPARRA